MTRDDAEDYTVALGQVFSGGWRLILHAQKQGIPQALGMTTQDWVRDRLNGYVRMGIDERREAVAELAEDGRSQREIAAVVGVDEKTIRRDIGAANAAEDDQKPSNDADDTADRAANAAPEPGDRFIGYDPPLKQEVITRDMAEAAETAAAVARVMADDSDLEMRRLRLKVQFSRELKHALELQCLKPEAIADVVDADLRNDIAYHFPLFRDWMDRVERALPRGLRVVS